MRLRITSIDEYQFLTCLKHGVWGSHKARFSAWKVGDLLAFIVNKRLAGLASITRPAFKSSETVWDNGLFPHRIPIKFGHVLLPDDRPPILGDVREALTSEWGPKYGLYILNQHLMESPKAEVIVGAISDCPNALARYAADLDPYLAEAKAKRELTSKHVAKKAETPTEASQQVPQDEISEAPISKKDKSLHTKTQSELIKLGKLTGCSVWIASNDQGASYHGKPLAEGCLKKLPGMGLSDDAMRRIALIDVIWVSSNGPARAFEVETSTGVYSGLLRMSDLLALAPALKMHLYIVAPRERQKKVFAELSRPTFDKIGLSEYCQYIATEDLADLIEKAEGFGGHIQPSVLDTIAVGLEGLANA